MLSLPADLQRIISLGLSIQGFYAFRATNKAIRVGLANVYKDYLIPCELNLVEEEDMPSDACYRSTLTIGSNDKNVMRYSMDVLATSFYRFNLSLNQLSKCFVSDQRFQVEFDPCRSVFLKDNFFLEGVTREITESEPGCWFHYTCPQIWFPKSTLNSLVPHEEDDDESY